MITIAILINGQPLTARSALNTGKTMGTKTIYQVDDGGMVFHDPNDGAVELCKLLLARIKEVKK